jgi:hypothetical protein
LIKFIFPLLIMSAGLRAEHACLESYTAATAGICHQLLGQLGLDPNAVETAREGQAAGTAATTTQAARDAAISTQGMFHNTHDFIKALAEQGVRSMAAGAAGAVIGEVLRDISELLLERGGDSTYEAIHLWCKRFASLYVTRIKKTPKKSKWLVDEMRLKIGKEIYWLWRAVDREGYALDLFCLKNEGIPKQQVLKLFGWLLVLALEKWV